MGDSDPPTPSNVELFFVERVEIDFPFLILQADVDIQLLPPHLLNGFGNHSMVLARVHENIEFGKAVTIWISRLSQKLSGSDRIIRYSARDRIVAESGRNKSGGRLFAAPQDIANQRFSINREVQGETNFGIVEWFMRHIENIKIDGKVRRNLQDLRRGSTVVWNLVQRNEFRLV